MMKRVAVLLLGVALCGLLWGCDLVNLGVTRVSDAGAVALQLSSVDVGWVEMNVTGPAGSFQIHWGDSYNPESYSDVDGPGVYTHWYSRAGRYAAVLLNGETVLATETVPVPTAQHHLELVAEGGRVLTVRYYGQRDTRYYICWGAVDIHADPGPQMGNVYPAASVVVGDGTAVGTELVHTYFVGNTYDVTMRLLADIPENARKFFTIVVP